MNEQVTTFIKVLLDDLLSAYALANLYRATNDKSHLETVERWIPAIEIALQGLRREIAHEKRPLP